MKHSISWLPNINRLENYLLPDDSIDYIRLIREHKQSLLNDFFNKSDPIMFNGCNVFLDMTSLDCSKLKIKACHNDDFYICSNCPFEGELDIINHIFTLEYDNKRLKKKNATLKLKKKSSRNKDLRTPGEFCIPRVLLSIWIKPIIMNANDTANVQIISKNVKGIQEYTLSLIHRKYKIHLKEIVSKNGFKYYVLKTAYFYTDPKSLIDLENDKYIKNVYKRRNATSGVSTTPCIDS